MEELIWEATDDDLGNTTYEAHGPYVDGFRWRLLPEMHNNRVVWTANHDQELGGDWDCVQWDTIEEAKGVVLEAHNRTLQQCEEA